MGEELLFGATYGDIGRACVGGLLLSVSSSLHLFTKGRITGMSGLLNGILTLDPTSLYWKTSMILGMIIASCIPILFIENGQTYFESAIEFKNGLSVAGFIIAGLLVGIGTKIGNGCTSGHGVCGLPRFSLRSFIAVACFMTTSVLTANVLNLFRQNGSLGFLLDSSQAKEVFFEDNSPNTGTWVVFITSIVLYIASIVYNRLRYQIANQIADQLLSMFIGVLFAGGLIISGMVKRHIVLGFLTFNSNWNPSLAFVLACAVLPNLITFHLILKEDRPLWGEKFQLPQKIQFDADLVVGACIFGVGWGLAGICPGPSFCQIPTVLVELVVYFAIPMMLGSLSVHLYEKYQSEKNIIPVGQGSPQKR